MADTPDRTGIRITRRFTTAGRDPYADLDLELRVARTVDHTTGTVRFEQVVEVPASWDQTATDVFASKYCRQIPVVDPPPVRPDGQPTDPDSGKVPEWSIRQVADRIAGAWRSWGLRGGYFASEEDADAYYDEMRWMIATQMGAPNSPQWFNTGLKEAYGLTGDPEGNMYVDPDTGRLRTSEDRYERSAVNACFIQRVEDTLVGPGGILDLATREARLFKAGSGSGVNYSTLRAAGEPLSPGGESSGALSFVRALDAMAGAIKSGGTTRRAARMVVLDADHPEVLDFVDTKVESERAARALIAAGWDRGFDTRGGAYDVVPWTNANHSVRLPARFGELLDDDGEVHLVERTTGRVRTTVRARELWERIVTAAWECADPGVQFSGIINSWHTGAADGPIRASNPCSEYLYLDDTACNLASVNLVRFFDGERFDTGAFTHAVRLWTITLELSVWGSHYPAAEIARRSYEHRTLGLGYANLGALLMRMGFPYDSPEARAVAGAVTSLMTMTAWETSAELAAVVGPAPAFDRNREHMLRVLRNHRRAAYGPGRFTAGIGDYEDLEVHPVGVDHARLVAVGLEDLSRAVIPAADQAVAAAETHGVRNMQVTVIAPTGTIGLVMGADTTGVEPDFALVKWKKLVGGGTMRIVNRSVPVALRRLGYSPEDIDRVVTHVGGTGTFAGDHPVNLDRLRGWLTPAEITALEDDLSRVSSITEAFSPHRIGTGPWERAGLDPGSTHPVELLESAGFTREEIVESDRVVFGHGTVEGCPVLADEHLAVFDCATPAGAGTRYIAPTGHVLMLAAVQPHVSGGISKTVNLPHEATVDDVRQVYELAYRTGVKCVAVYRDGCKASQPLGSVTDLLEAPTTDDDPRTATVPEPPQGMSPTEYYGGAMPPRFRLPANRPGRTFSFEIGGMQVYLTTGEYDDGSLGEIWLALGKDGSTLRGMFGQFAMAVSLALQRGVPLEHLVDKFTGQLFAPNGPVAKNPNLKFATSIPDAVFRLLGWWYLGRDDLVQNPDRGAGPTNRVEPDPSPRARAGDATTPRRPERRTREDRADGKPSGSPPAHRSGGYTGDLCPNCHSPRMIRSGTCARCEDCGTTTGCS